MRQNNQYAIELFHRAEDGDDWTPAIMRAQLQLSPPGTPSVLTYRPITLVFASREYACRSRVDIIRPQVSLIGSKRGSSIVSTVSTTTVTSPTIYFPNGGACGFDNTYPGRYQGGTYGPIVIAADALARGGPFHVEGLVIVGPGVSSGWVGEINDHAFNVHQGISITNCAIRGFRGYGIHCNASASASSPNLGNNNGSDIGPNVSIYYCGAGGIEIAGGDANQCVVDRVSMVECGLDMIAREGLYTAIIAGRQVHRVSITAVLPSTLYRLVVGGTACDFTTSASPSFAEVVDGLVASIAAAGLATGASIAIDTDRLLVYGTTNAGFTCTANANMSVSSVAPTATAQTIYCIGGPAGTQLDIGDNASFWMPSQSWRGIMRGDVVDHGTRGYLEISTKMEDTLHTAASISFVSGTTWRLTVDDGRVWTSQEHTGLNITIYGATNAANEGSFPTTRVDAGVYSATSNRFRVNYAQPNGRYWLRINGTEVSVVAGASPTTTAIRDQFIAAINAAGITGVTSTTFDADEFNVVGETTVGVGPWLDNVGGAARTFIEYTNASGEAEAVFGGQWRITNREVPQNTYAPVGGVYIRGRGLQALDQPLIRSTWRDCLINGSTAGDGYVAKGGYSKFYDCYTEGPLQSVILPPAEIVGGSMYPVINAKTAEIGDYFIYRPAVVAGMLHGANGTMQGAIGDPSYSNAALGWEYRSSVNGDVVKLMRAQTAQGAGCYELVMNPGAGASARVLQRWGANNNNHIGPGTPSIGGEGMFVNYANGSVEIPRSAWSNGTSGITYTNDSATMGGAIGYLGWCVNGSYSCRRDVQRCFLVNTITASSHGSVSIGVHGFAVGARGRVLIRNARGITGANGDHQWTRNASSSIFLEDASGTNQTTTGTHVTGTGIAIIYRLVVTGTPTFTDGALTLTDGSWVAGDRFVAHRSTTAVEGQTTEWVCTTTGIGPAATWRRVSTDGAVPSGSIYASVSAATVFGAPGTPVPVLGTTALQSGSTLCDMPASGRLRYTGQELRSFQVDARLSLVPAGAADNVEAFVYHTPAATGVPVIVAGSGQRASLGAAGNVANLSLRCELTLRVNDYIEVWLANETSTNSITASRLQLAIWSR